ncbi:NAD(P)H-dependent oxidoreductase subunit E [Shewanella woodyi]|uniref:NADH-quinone oxidoreductase subunit F n=1 Tax=Shewanella woodyi (strain ATCC 51908 / MS32) TaxID=392500 RepID=B1KFK8_SHEWM|nr:NAD(P)H-dependent oxidoreductase subunit E [Shewanella woodyi]ACA88183.1 Respiratory-chain NADH dehydrogenase domain 51 kDa subunit [Shewanella woodyi ATCC 51908]
MTEIRDAGIWKSAKGKGRATPKGRQLSEGAFNEVQQLIKDMPLRRDLLIEYLHRVQDTFGHLSAPHIKALADHLNIGEAEVYEVASFYAHFDLIKEGQTPPPATTLRVCNSLSCTMAGADELADELNKTLDNQEVRVLRAPCMGRCNTAPTVALGRNHIDHATPAKLQQAISSNAFTAPIPCYQSLTDYLAGGGYQFYEQMKASTLDPIEVEDKVFSAGLRGMGGAGFPSGKKWSFVRAESGPRYMAVNGDEGEPGTFKDRYYLETQPHLFMEGMLIAAQAVEAEHIYLYLRDEYPAALTILKREIAELESANIVPIGYIELRRGAGAYICGEESAMIESIEGKRGLPRHRPPFVAQKGIFNQPTLVHNIETLYWVARICREGGEILTSVSKNGRTGLRSYSVSGRVINPGVYLLPAGSTITDLIEAAGGMIQGHRLKAYQPGGPSSGILPASLADVPLDFDTLQPHGSLIGSAAVLVLSDKDSIRDAALNMMEFFDHENCGQCTPCRVGCEKAVKLMREDKWDTSLLSELSSVMEDASICGLGQAAPNPIRLTIKHFPDEV